MTFIGLLKEIFKINPIHEETGWSYIKIRKTSTRP